MQHRTVFHLESVESRLLLTSITLDAHGVLHVIADQDAGQSILVGYNRLNLPTKVSVQIVEAISPHDHEFGDTIKAASFPIKQVNSLDLHPDDSFFNSTSLNATIEGGGGDAEVSAGIATFTSG